MKQKELKVLAQKAVHGYVTGNISVVGMNLSNAQKLRLFRKRKKEPEKSIYRKMNLFLYICLQVWRGYYDKCEEIIRLDRSIKMKSGQKVYPELSQISEDIAFCLVMYSLHITARDFNEFKKMDMAYRVYNATKVLHKELYEKAKE
jgi:hypothetical protein